MHPLTELTLILTLIATQLAGIVAYFYHNIKIDLSMYKTIIVSENARFNAADQLKSKGMVVTENITIGAGVVALKFKCVTIQHLEDAKLIETKNAPK